MKKFLKILFIVIIVILVLLIAIPFLFKDQILEKVKEEINKNLNARVEFAEFKLSLIKKFPNLNVALNEISVVGVDEFDEDTLAYLNSFSIVVDLMSVIKGDAYKVKSIILDNPIVLAKVLENGMANWDIAKETEEEEPDTTTSKPLDLKVKLKKFKINNAYIIYDDKSLDVLASLENLNFTLKGDLAMDFSTLDIFTSIKFVNIAYEGLRYLKDASFSFSAKVDADLINSVYTIKENEIALNQLIIGIVGSISMPDENIKIDMKFNTKKTDFKTILSLIPAVYKTDFEDVQTVGILALDGYVKGVYNENSLPSAGLNLIIQNAMFKYPDLPKSVDNINVDVKLYYDGVNDDSSTVDINKFHLKLANNPMDMNFHIKTPVSDPQINGKISGNIDLTSVADVIPLEDFVLKGMININLDMAGKLSSIENEKFEEFKADGSVDITSFEFQSMDVPQGVIIRESSLAFSPQFVELVSFDAKIGNSDIQLKGKIENFLPYVFKDEIIKGNLAFSSRLLDLNEFLVGEFEEEVEETDTIVLELFEVPKNIDFKLTSTLDQIFYDKLEIKNVTGLIEIKDGKVLLDNLAMNLLEGSMKLSGEYNTQDISKPFVTFGMEISNFDIPSAFNSFRTIEKIAPIAKNCKGKVSSNMKFTSLLDEHMNPVLGSIDGEGRLISKNIMISNSNTFNKIADTLRSDKFRTFSLNDIDINFTISNGRIYIEPFETNIGNISLIIGGDQGIDETMNYLINMTIPRSEFGSRANQVLDDLTSAALAKGMQFGPGEKMNVSVKVMGTFTDPEIKLDLIESAGKTADKIKEQVKEQIRKEVVKKKEEVKEKVREEVNAEAERLIQQAEKKAETIRETAAKMAEKLRKEADEKANKLIKEAENKPKFAQKIAEIGAEKLRKEADEKAEKLIQKAEKESEAILVKARKEAEKLKNK